MSPRAIGTTLHETTLHQTTLHQTTPGAPGVTSVDV